MAKFAYGATIILDIGDGFNRPTFEDLIHLLEEKSYEDVDIVDSASGDVVITLKGATNG